MPLRIKKQSQSSEKETNTAISKPEKPTNPESQSWNIFRLITELPLSNWISYTVDNNIYALVKSGKPPDEELQKAGADLRVQFADASGDHQYRMYCGLLKEITDLQLTMAQIESLVNTLREAYHPYFAKQLNNLLQTSFVFDVKKPEQYDKLLDRCINRSKSITINIGLKSVAFKALEEKYSKAGGKPTREYYLGILITISETYSLSDNISVWEFCERIKRYNKKHEQPVKAKK